MYDPGKPSDPRSLPGGVASPQAAHRAGRAVDPYRVLQLLRRAKIWLVAALLVGGVVGYSVGKWLLPRRYVAVASLVYEGVPEIEGIPSVPESELPTLRDSVKLPTNLAAVRDHVGYEGPLDELGTLIDVEVENASNVMNVSAEAGTSDRAASLANAMVDVYVEHRASVERTRLQEYVGQVDADLESAHGDLDSARTAYDQFRTEHGITDFTVEQQQAIEAAAALRAQSDQARAEGEAQDARVRELQSAARHQQRSVVSETQTSPEAAALAQARTELAQVSSRLTDAHPRVQALRQRVATLEQEVANAHATVTDRVVTASPSYEALQGDVSSSAASRQAARQREETLGGLIHAAEDCIAHLNEFEGEANALLASVHAAEAHVETLEARKHALLDLVDSPSTGFRVVSRAVPPETPLPSKARYAAAFGTPVIAVLIVLLAFGWRELRGFKVVTAREVGYWGRGPVVGATTWPADRPAIYEFVAELDDFLPDARGSTLIVGATVDEARIATQLAGKLRDEWTLDSTVAIGSQPIEARGGSTSLALRDGEADALAVRTDSAALVIEPYQGPDFGPRLRRAVRLADRVIVVVPSGKYTAVELTQFRERLGRDHGVGFVVVDLPSDLSGLPDRAGDVAEFWLSPPRANDAG